MHAHCKIEVTR